MKLYIVNTILTFQTFDTLRRKAKRKKAVYLTQCRRTGNKQPTVELTQYEERLCKLYGVEGLGLNIGNELGFRRINLNNCNIVTHFLFTFIQVLIIK